MIGQLVDQMAEFGASAQRKFGFEINNSMDVLCPGATFARHQQLPRIPSATASAHYRDGPGNLVRISSDPSDLGMVLRIGGTPPKG